MGVTRTPANPKPEEIISTQDVDNKQLLKESVQELKQVSYILREISGLEIDNEDIDNGTI